jgi:hypothetical protein
VPHDRTGLVEFFPQTREVRRLVVRLFLLLLDGESKTDNERRSLITAIE